MLKGDETYILLELIGGVEQVWFSNLFLSFDDNKVYNI